MATSFNKKELEKRKEQKRKEKQQRKEERKAGGSRSFEDMIAYVDENGVITDTPPDPDRKKKEVELETIIVSTPRKEEMEEPALEGRVEYFNRDKGYGFIKNLPGTEKYFFHVSNAPATIAEGNMVTFELERGDRGMNAVKIVLAR
ncbi:MAG: cold shock domain-containing protein [Tannerella sp.]|jgi:cold shock CspA family protein|nr:cold shock domain-containing protein [Tannerella sp.]